jgi:hypothetical protein
MKKSVKINEARGYWEMWQRPCGHNYRVVTEFSWSDKKALAYIRKDAAAAACSRCLTDSEVTS